MVSKTKSREMEHFNKLSVNPLGFLEKDDTAFRRFMIRFLLSRWDSPLIYIPTDFLEGKTVLDACCGNPRVICWMKSRGATAFGCDLSTTMLTMGNASGYSYTLGEKVELSPVRWMLADCEELPFPDESFDTVTCFQALHHININRFLAECSRILKPGGNLVISDPNGAHPLRRLGNLMGRSMGLLSKDERSMPPAEIVAKLAENGFHAQAVHSINFLSEIIFLIEEILRNQRPFISALLRASLFAIYPLDWLLDRTLFKILPVLSWRCVFICKKTG